MGRLDPGGGGCAHEKDDRGPEGRCLPCRVLGLARCSPCWVLGFTRCSACWVLGLARSLPCKVLALLGARLAGCQVLRGACLAHSAEDLMAGARLACCLSEHHEGHSAKSQSCSVCCLAMSPVHVHCQSLSG